MWLLLLILATAVIYLIIKSVIKYRRMAISPFDALKLRYSKGDITRNEYEQLKKDIES